MDERPDETSEECRGGMPDVEAFMRGEAICEEHPDKPWPHDDCPGPGMPPPKRD